MPSNFVASDLLNRAAEDRANAGRIGPAAATGFLAGLDASYKMAKFDFDVQTQAKKFALAEQELQYTKTEQDRQFALKSASTELDDRIKNETFELTKVNLGLQQDARKLELSRQGALMRDTLQKINFEKQDVQLQSEYDSLASQLPPDKVMPFTQTYVQDLFKEAKATENPDERNVLMQRASRFQQKWEGEVKQQLDELRTARQEAILQGDHTAAENFRKQIQAIGGDLAVYQVNKGTYALQEQVAKMQLAVAKLEEFKDNKQGKDDDADIRVGLAGLAADEDPYEFLDGLTEKATNNPNLTQGERRRAVQAITSNRERLKAAELGDVVEATAFEEAKNIYTQNQNNQNALVAGTELLQQISTSTSSFLQSHQNAAPHLVGPLVQMDQVALVTDYIANATEAAGGTLDPVTFKALGEVRSKILSEGFSAAKAAVQTGTQEFDEAFSLFKNSPALAALTPEEQKVQITNKYQELYGVHLKTPVEVLGVYTGKVNGDSQRTLDRAKGTPENFDAFEFASGASEATPAADALGDEANFQNPEFTLENALAFDADPDEVASIQQSVLEDSQAEVSRIASKNVDIDLYQSSVKGTRLTESSLKTGNYDAGRIKKYSSILRGLEKTEQVKGSEELQKDLTGLLSVMQTLQDARKKDNGSDPANDVRALTLNVNARLDKLGGKLGTEFKKFSTGVKTPPPDVRSVPDVLSRLSPKELDIDLYQSSVKGTRLTESSLKSGNYDAGRIKKYSSILRGLEKTDQVKKSEALQKDLTGLLSVMDTLHKARKDDNTSSGKPGSSVRSLVLNVNDRLDKLGGKLGTELQKISLPGG